MEDGMKDKSIIIVWAMILTVVLVAITVTTKILVDGNIRATEIRELKR
jgi:hypothetical protein